MRILVSNGDGIYTPGIEAYRVDGTPADCVALGAHLWGHVDLVLSGITLGPNLGNATGHSGTLAARGLRRTSQAVNAGDLRRGGYAAGRRAITSITADMPEWAGPSSICASYERTDSSVNADSSSRSWASL